MHRDPASNKGKRGGEPTLEVILWRLYTHHDRHVRCLSFSHTHTYFSQTGKGSSFLKPEIWSSALLWILTSAMIPSAERCLEDMWHFSNTWVPSHPFPLVFSDFCPGFRETAFICFCKSLIYGNQSKDSKQDLRTAVLIKVFSCLSGERVALCTSYSRMTHLQLRHVNPNRMSLISALFSSCAKY